MRRRAALLSLLLLASGLGASEGFETGTGIWSPQAPPGPGAAYWHRVVAPACVDPHSGLACMYFGIDGACNYDDGLIKDASLTAGPVTLTDPAEATLDFWILYQVESVWPGCYDKLVLEHSPDGVSWYLLQDLSYTSLSPPDGGSSAAGFSGSGGVGAPPLWVHAPPVDLTSFVGVPLWLRFRFVSWAGQFGNDLCVGGPDAEYDDYLGYALDDIRLGEGGAPLQLAKQVAPPVAAPGDTFTFSFSAYNGTSSTTDVALWDSLPAGAIAAGSIPLATFAGGLANWLLPAVAPYSTATAQLMLQVPAGAAEPSDWFNTAAGTGPGGMADSNGVWARVRQAGLSVRKVVDYADVNNGDQSVFTIVVENASPVTQNAQLIEQIPSGFVLDPDYPSPPFDPGTTQWSLTLAPGDLRLFALAGTVVGLDGQVLTNTAQLWQGANLTGTASAAVHVHTPVTPQLTLNALYPNPAPGSAAWGDYAHIYYSASVDMPVVVDIFTVAGERVRRLEGQGPQDQKGSHQLDWDLANQAGRRVASGVYLIRLYTSASLQPQPQAFGYLAVIR